MLPLPRYVTSFIITANSQKPRPLWDEQALAVWHQPHSRTVDAPPETYAPACQKRSCAPPYECACPVVAAVLRSGELRHAHPQALEIFATPRPPSTITSRSI